MIQHEHLQPDRYAMLPMEPLRIMARTYHDTHIVAYDAIHFDGILAAAMVMDATEGCGLPDSGPEPYLIPLPLECVWSAPDSAGRSAGLPLWAASCLHPVSASHQDVILMHKRAHTGELTKSARGNYSITTKTGRWMERRTATPTIVAERWEAYAIGNAGEIRRLLALISHVGKRRGAGLGWVREWVVEPADPGGELVRDGVLARPIPNDAARILSSQPAPNTATHLGWTPPYWHPATQAAGWSAGTPLQTAEAICT